MSKAPKSHKLRDVGATTCCGLYTKWHTVVIDNEHPTCRTCLGQNPRRNITGKRVGNE